MDFCKKCGKELEQDEDFCTNCGTSVTKKSNERKMVYEGEIHKCPNCGEILKGFEIKCSSCAYEIRNSESSVNIKEFSNKISSITSQEELVKVIRNFPIPNNKEDILEFMILASSNIIGEKSREIFEAWRVKFEQSYQKARLTFENDRIYDKIEKIYKETIEKIEKEKNIHNVLDLKKWLDKIMINPIFGFTVIGVAIYSIIRLISGNFAGIDIIFDAIILTVVYKKTNKKDRGGN